MASDTQLSQAAYDRLQAELEELTTRGRIEIARKIESAREMGDLSENGDYHAAKEEKGKMEGRVMRLEYLLEDCQIVAKTDDGVVATGMVVSLLYEGDTEPESFLLGSIEERHDGLDVISPGSPLGVALMGASEGDTVEFESPTGATLSVKVAGVGE